MDLLPVQPAPPPKIKPHENEYGKKLADLQWSRRRSLGYHIDLFIKDGKVFGSGRNQACYVAAKKMYSVGVSEQEAIQLLSHSPFDRTDFLDREIETAVKSAYSTTV